MDLHKFTTWLLILSYELQHFESYFLCQYQKAITGQFYFNIFKFIWVYIFFYALDNTEKKWNLVFILRWTLELEKTDSIKTLSEVLTFLALLKCVFVGVLIGKMYQQFPPKKKVWANHQIKSINPTQRNLKDMITLTMNYFKLLHFDLVNTVYYWNSFVVSVGKVQEMHVYPAWLQKTSCVLYLC